MRVPFSVPASFADNISWPSLELVIDSGNIMPDNPKADHQDAADEKLQKDYRGKALLGGACKIPVQGLDSQDDGEQKHDPAHECDKLHGSAGEGSDIPDGIADQAAERPLGGSHRALLYLEGHGGGLKTDP